MATPYGGWEALPLSSPQPAAYVVGPKVPMGFSCHGTDPFPVGIETCVNTVRLALSPTV